MTNLTGKYILTAIVPFVVAILAMAFPLMQSATAKISGQYKSTLLARTFQNEFAYCWFVTMLVASLVSLLVYFFQFPALPVFADCWLVANSAVLLVYLCAVLLITSLLCLAHKIDVYYDQGKLAKRLVCRYNRTNKCYEWCKRITPAKCEWLTKKIPAFDKSTFNAISKLMNYSIDNADEELAREMFSFFTEAFVLYRKGQEGQEVVYPDEFYNAVFEASEQLCLRKRKTVSYYNDGSLYDFFIDPFQNTKLSAKTVRLMWMCVIQNVTYGKFDYIFGLWKKLYQQASLVLDNNPDNQLEKSKFIEFGQVLCAYVMASGEYETVRKMLEFTQMKPAKYVLTPSSTQGVIDAYKEIDKHNEFDSYNFPVYFESLYPQPGVDGVDVGDVIQHRIYDFLGLSFLWQYVVPQTYQTHGYSDTIYGGQDAADKQKTIEILERLQKNVAAVSINNSLCEAVGLKNLVYDKSYNGHKSPKQWFEDNIKIISDQLAIQQDADERGLTIPPEMVQRFNEKVSSSCIQMFSEIKPFLSDKDKANKNAFVNLSWRCDVKMKSHVVRSMNYVEVTGTLLAQDFRINIWLPLLHMNVNRYTLREEDAISIVLNRIRRKRLVILNFGIMMNEAKMVKDGLLKKEDDRIYNQFGVEIVSVQSYPIYPALAHTFIIVRKVDFPSLVINDVSQDMIDELRLTKIEPTHKLYTSVIDFNLPQWCGIKSKYCRDVGNEDKYAMFCSFVNGELHYKPEAKVMQLNIYNQFTDRISPQKPDEVGDVWKK